MQGDLFEQDDFVPLENAGRRVNCQRCGSECQVARVANQAAKIGRRADGDGYCPDCAITHFLQTEIDMEWTLPPGVTIGEALSAPHIQRQFESLLRVGRSDMQVGEIQWERVIQNWNLPFKKARKRK